MRSKFSCLTAAMIIFGAISGATFGAHAADPKKNGASKKKSNEIVNDNFDKQMSWENSVLGPDDKKAEMAKMARANAMAKAAAEKAAAEKAAAERNAVKEEAKQQRAAATKTAAPVLLATPQDETAGKSTRNNDKFAEEPAPAPAPPPKPADDKFIDKILKGEASKKKVVRNDDELNELLAKDKIAPAPRAKGKRVDNVDDLLRSAEKQPDMPAPKTKTPDWAKIEPETTPRPVAIAPRPQPKKDDGVIHIVQGAAGTMSAPPPAPRPQMAAATSARRAQNTDTFDRRDSDPFAEVPRKRSASVSAPARSSASFADPFADSGAPAPRARSVVTPRPVAPPPAPRAMPVPASRREAASPPPGWSDPFADAPADRGKPVKRTTEPKRAAPAGHPPGWKDPFSDAAPVHHRTSSVVAMTETHRRGGSTRGSASGSATASTWGVLKKQPRH